MIKRTSLLSLPFYAKSPFTGSYNGMRYRIAKTTENEQTFLTAYVYPEPFSFEKTADEKKISSSFEFSEEGLSKACEWLNEQYDNNTELWKHKEGRL